MCVEHVYYINVCNIFITQITIIIISVDGRQCGNNLALCNFAVVMELPDSLWMNWKSEFGVQDNANFFFQKRVNHLC